MEKCFHYTSVLKKEGEEERKRRRERKRERKKKMNFSRFSAESGSCQRGRPWTLNSFFLLL